MKDKTRGWMEKDAALVVLELLYTARGMAGALNFQIVDAELYRDTEVISKMDPYVIIRYGGRDVKTSTKNEAGKRPVWNETFTIPVTSIN